MNAFAAAAAGVIFIIAGCAFLAIANRKAWQPPVVPLEVSTPKGETGSGTVTMGPKETTVQRYLRTEAEWRRLNDLARNEQTELKQKSDAAFRDYMDADRALKAEAAKP